MIDRLWNPIFNVFVNIAFAMSGCLPAVFLPLAIVWGLRLAWEVRDLQES